MGDLVRDWMSADPVVIGADASALEAHEVMLRRGIRHLPVVDEKCRVVGVLSSDDLRAALPLESGYFTVLPAAARAEAIQWRVGDLMTHLPETLGPLESLAVAARRMAERRIGCLPIVDRDRVLVGSSPRPISCARSRRRSRPCSSSRIPAATPRDRCCASSSASEQPWRASSNR
jgi:acetoin utilization protein AcuB